MNESMSRLKEEVKSRREAALEQEFKLALESLLTETQQQEQQQEQGRKRKSETIFPDEEGLPRHRAPKLDLTTWQRVRLSTFELRITNLLVDVEIFGLNDPGMLAGGPVLRDQLAAARTELRLFQEGLWQADPSTQGGAHWTAADVEAGVLVSRLASQTSQILMQQDLPHVDLTM